MGNTKKQVIILKGLIASGKSTWAKAQVDSDPENWVRFNKDDLRLMIHNGNWSRTNEKVIEDIRDNLLMLALGQGKSVIIDDTNFAPKHEARIRELAGHFAEVEVSVKFFDIGLQEAILRDAGRDKPVGRDVICKMYRQYVLPEKIKARNTESNRSKPKAVICDLDGTLAIFGSERSPYDASTCENDKVNDNLNLILRCLYDRYNNPVKIIFVSGREDKYEVQTKNWLVDQGWACGVGSADTELFMRKEGDKRKDTVIKEEIYRAHIQANYDVVAVFDDRPCVISMWKSLGLFVCDVGEGVDF